MLGCTGPLDCCDGAATVFQPLLRATLRSTDWRLNKRNHAQRIHEGHAGASASGAIDPYAGSVIQSAGHVGIAAVISAVLSIVRPGPPGTPALTHQTHQCHRLKRRIKASSTPPEERQA
jgi:hypothetical protein